LRRAVHLAASSAIAESPLLPRLVVPDGSPILVAGVAGPNGAGALESVPLTDGDPRSADDQPPAGAPAPASTSRPDGESPPERSGRGFSLRLPWSRH